MNENVSLNAAPDSVAVDGPSLPEQRPVDMLDALLFGWT